MHQWKEPFGYVEVNNTLAVAGESMDREAAQGAHQASLSHNTGRWFPHLRAKYTATLS